MITVSDYALMQMPHAIRNDPWAAEILRAAGATLDPLAEKIISVWNSDDFSALNLDQIQRMEKLLGIISSGSTLEDRRAAIQSAWRTNAAPTKEMTQRICDGWHNGVVAVDYEDGIITLTFSGEIGVPEDINGLKAALERALPAHLTIVYAYRYLLIGEIHDVMTIAEMESQNLNKFAGGE